VAQVGRPGFSLQQKRMLWERWKKGESIYDIARALGKSPSSIHWVFRSCGGIPPATRIRASAALSVSEREEISRGLVGGQSLRQIASRLRRAPSTISREVVRNGGRLRYRAVRADERAWSQGRRSKACRLAQNLRLKELVAQMLADDWSPEQIAGWLRTTYPADNSMHVSPETIYRTLFLQARASSNASCCPTCDGIRSCAAASTPAPEARGS
jgi:transposase, IS30 family